MYNKLYFDKENMPKTHEKTEFGNRLRKLRKDKGESQEYVSEMLGYKKGTYGTYENSRYIPDADTAAQLADYFNVTADYLLGLTDDPDIAQNEILVNTNFNAVTKDKLLDIAKDSILTEVFEMLIANPKFREILYYINTYLIYSQRLDTGAVYELQSAYKDATRIDLSKNAHLSTEQYPVGGIKMSDVYIDMIKRNLEAMIKDMSNENKREYKKKITQIARDELSEPRNGLV